MAEISKLSKVAIADVAKVDAVLKADIANFNGLTIPSAAAFLLDTYTGAAVAYSVRRLNSSYTGACMRVREDGGNTETDIGFDANGELDTAAIASHCGVNNGYVRYWYDQSTAGGTGSGNDAGQATAASQLKIYDGTNGIEERGSSGNEKPALVPTNNAAGFESISVDLRNSDVSSFIVAESNNNFAVGVKFTGDNERILLAHANNTSTDGAFSNLTVTNATCHFNGVSQTLPVTRGDIHTQFRDNQTLASQVNYSGVLSSTINIQNIANFFRVFVFQEIVFWDADQSSNRTGIETDINGYFNIY